MAKQNLPGFDFSDAELLVEIKEISEKNLNDDLMVLSIAAGFTQPAKPHLEFEYPDLEIQEDIYQLMKYSCREVCTPEQCDKVMKIWTTFLEPFIGVPACPPSTEDKNHAVKTNNNSKQNLKQIGQVNSGHADVVAYCKAADMPKSGDEHVPPKDSFPNRVQMARGNYRNSNNGYPGVDNVASKSAILCNSSLTAAGDNIMNEENGSGQTMSSEGETDCMMDVDDTEGVMPISDRLLQTVKPLTVNIPSALKGKEKNSHIFYGNDSFYLLFRLHQMLYERLLTAKLHFSSPDNKWRISNDSNSEDSYAIFKDALRSLLNGSYDNTKFEDECRALVGDQSYILFTLDKLILKLIKQLRIISTEQLDSNLLHLYAYERSRSPETFCDAVYYENARFLLLDDSLYRIEFLSRPMRFTMRLMKTENGKLDPTAVSMDPYFSYYLNDELLAVPERMEKSGVFLKRNKKLYSSEDEYSNTNKAMEGLVTCNGVQMKVNSSTFKMSYVMGTEDFMYRPKKTRRVLYGKGASNGTPNGCLHRAKRCKLFHD